MRCSISPLLVLALAATAACGSDAARIAGGSEGPTRLLLTGVPLPADSVSRIDLYVSRIDIATNADTAGVDFLTVASPERRFNLLDLQHGTSELLGTTNVHFGAIALVRVRLNLDSSGVMYAGGGTGDLPWSGTGEYDAFALVEQPLVSWAEDEGDIVVEFNADQRMVRAVNGEASARLGGTVFGHPDPTADAIPMPFARVHAWRIRGDEEPTELASGTRTALDGTFVFRHLNAGTYLLVAEPAEGFAGVPTSSATTVHLLMGDDRTLNVTTAGGADTTQQGGYLSIGGPNPVALGDTVPWHAVVFDSAGDSLSAAGAQWLSRNPSVASVIGSGASVQVAAEALGTAWLVASVDDLVDSVVVSVVSETDTTGGGGTGGPVATVTVVPGAISAIVDDSVGFYAELRDSTGALLSGRTVTWTVSDSSVVQIYGTYGQAIILWTLTTGTATVTATSEGKAGSGTVTVN